MFSLPPDTQTAPSIIPVPTGGSVYYAGEPESGGSREIACSTPHSPAGELCWTGPLAASPSL